VSDNRQTFSCDVLVGLELEESFFHYEPRNLDWRRYWIDQHVPGLRRWSFPVFDNKKVELYVPKEPVRLDDTLLAGNGQSQGAALPKRPLKTPSLEARGSGREPKKTENGEAAGKKRARGARAVETPTRVAPLEEKVPEVFE
jgi:hypothetical protein